MAGKLLLVVLVLVNLKEPALVSTALGDESFASPGAVQGRPWKPDAKLSTGAEPMYDGQPLSFWLNECDFTSSRSPTPLTEEAKIALAAIGTNAIPFLLARIRQADGNVDSGTIGAFGVLGSTARAAIPELARFATNRAEHSSAPPPGSNSIVVVGSGPMLALGRIGPEALPILVDIATNAVEPGRRLGAVQAIGSMGTNAASALPVLVSAANDDCEFVAWESVRALGIIGPAEPAVVAPLSRLSQSTNRVLRGQALMALGNCGATAAPALIRGLGLADVGCYNIAFTSLVAASPQSLTNAAVLMLAAEGLRSGDSDRRGWAASLLRAAGQQAEGTRPDYAVPRGDMKAIFREATNALERLAPQLLNKE
jgi:HEAT repeat protein